MTAETTKRPPNYRKPSKLTPETIEKLGEALRIGTTVENACDYVGIAQSTYYLWMAIARACANDEPHDYKPQKKSAQQPYLDLLETVNRAQAAAQFTAVTALRSGMVAATTEEETVETFAEVRLRQSANGEQVPYTYTRTKTTKKRVKHPADWRAATDFLKRRYPREWGDKLNLNDDRSMAIKDIRNGTLTFEMLVEAGDYEFAAGLFAEAGVPVPYREGAES